MKLYLVSVVALVGAVGLLALSSCMSQPGEDNKASTQDQYQNADVSGVSIADRAGPLCDCSQLVGESQRAAYPRISNVGQRHQVQCTYLADRLQSGVKSASITVSAKPTNFASYKGALSGASEEFMFPPEQLSKEVVAGVFSQVFTGLVANGQLRISLLYSDDSQSLLSIRELIRLEKPSDRINNRLFGDRSQRIMPAVYDRYRQACQGNAAVK